MISIASDGINIWTISQNVTTNLIAKQGQRIYIAISSDEWVVRGVSWFTLTILNHEP